MFGPVARRALYSAASPCMCISTLPLDVLAPAYASSSHNVTTRHAHTAPKPVIRETTTGSPRRKPLHKRSPSPSTSHSPADILQKVRATTVMTGEVDSHVGDTALTANEHNRAMQNLLVGPRLKSAEDRYQRAFVQGWRRIRLAGNAARPRPEDLAHVLPTTHSALRSDKDETVWPQVKELVLWLAGEHDAPGVVAWSWHQIQGGKASGLERVVEVWDAIQNGQHSSLRNGPDALDYAFKSSRPVREVGEVPGGVFAAFIAARCLLNMKRTSPQPFADIVPPLITQDGPFLKSFVEREQLDKNLKSLPKAQAEQVGDWIRQAYFAQLWFDSRKRGTGFGVVRLARQYFRTANPSHAWKLWTALTQAVASDHVKWISTERWADSASERMLADTASEEEAPEDALSEQETDAVRTQTTVAGRAFLSQAHVVPFLSGFTRAEMYDKATDIWSWLDEHGLQPGAALWNALIFGYAARGDVEAVELVVRDMQAAGVEPDIDTWLERISARFENKQPDEAMRLAEAMEQSSAAAKLVGGRLPPSAYDRIILGLLGNGRPEQAESVLEHMDTRGVPATVHTINNLLRHYTRSRKPDLPSIVRCIQQISDRRLDADVFTYTMVLQSLLNAGHKDAVAKVIKMMESSGVRPTPTTYGTIINDLASSGEPDKLQAAVKLVEEMEAKGIVTNEIIYTSVMQGFLRAAANSPARGDGVHPYVEAAFQLKERMQDRGIVINRVAYNALIGAALDLRSSSGIELAMTLFRELQQQRRLWHDVELDRSGQIVPLSQTWLVLLSGLADMAQWRLARELVAEMEQSGFKAQGRALIRVIDKIQRGGYVR
ncbi:hypothetical protein ACM66B_001873 [Microbotryomycetes sp. NB124-2]